MLDFLNANPILIMFAIAVIGYAFGRIRIKGLDLGTAAILLVALVFGYFSLAIPPIVQDLGLALFVTAVGFIAGPTFFRNFKSKAVAYVALGAIIVLAGVLTCSVIILLSGIDTDFAVGVLAGALTTTPGLGVAKEAATDPTMATIGYGVAYPFGVIGVVLFVQLMPKIFKTDMKKERAQFVAANEAPKVEKKKKVLSMDPLGFFSFALAVILGYLLGKIEIPLPGGVTFALGTSGGPLIAGLVFGHFGSALRVDLKIKKETLVSLRELGLALFLMGAGTKAGAGFEDVLAEQGAMLFVNGLLYGAIMTIIPMIVGSFFALKVFKLSMFNSLGTVCGGMTSTPALGALIQTTGTDDVTTAYAAAYPIAIAVIVISFQLVFLIF